MTRSLRRIANRALRYRNETCGRCGRRVGLVWTANDDLYALVTGITNGSGVFCIRCFDALADARTRVMLRWVPFISYDYELGRSLEPTYAGSLYPARADQVAEMRSSA